MKNIMNQQLSTKAIKYGLCMGALLLTAATASAASSLVYFQVDMSAQLGSTFNPPPPAGTGTDTVWVQGTINGWGGQLVLVQDSSRPTVWTNTFNDTTDANGTVMSYKFGMTSDNYECPLAEGNCWNRCVTLPATSGASLNLPYTYFADAGPAETLSITFSVDMAEEANIGNFNPNTMSVYCQGWFEGWSDANFQLFPNTAAFVTNVGNIVSMPYTNTFTTWAASPGEQSDFKYVYNNGSDNYESVNATNQNPSSGNRFFFNVTNLTLPTVFFDDLAYSKTVTNTIMFEVDMSVQVLSGNFTNGVSEVEILGDPSINNWTFTPLTEEAAPNTNIYYTNCTIVGAAGEAVQFKYYNPVPGPGGTYENPAAANLYPDSDNRYLTLAGTNGTFTNYVYWSDLRLADVTPTACMATFTVDMTPAVNGSVDADLDFTPGFDTVEINGLNGGVDGSYWTWTDESESIPSQFIMTWLGGSYGDGNIYTLTIPVNAGQPLNLQYKYGIDGQDNEAPEGDNHNRYLRTISNSGFGYVMPADYFDGQGNGNATEPSLGNLGVKLSGGGQVKLSWLGRTTVHLQSTTNLTPPITWTQLPLTDGTNLIVTPGTNLPIAPSAALGTNVSTNYPVGSGRVFYELIGPQ
jgi:hypothetical protein